MAENEFDSHGHSEDITQSDPSDVLRQRSSIEVRAAKQELRTRAMGKRSLDAIPTISSRRVPLDARERPTIKRRTGIRFR